MTLAAEPYRMSPSEIARGYVVDLERHHPRALVDGPLPDPRTVLEEVLLEGLQRRRCIVAFSGGRDSSALLALAASVAVREGLPLPAAVTRRFPGFPETDEAAWQEQVIHVGIDDWERVDPDDEALDLLGPVARSRLERYGVLWPPLLRQDAPAVEPARNGILVDGEGGDQILGLDLHRIAPAMLAWRFRSHRSPRHLASAAAVLAPGAVQRAVQAHRIRSLETPWLRDEPARHLRREIACEQANLPLRWDASIRVFPAHRGRRHGLQSRELLAAEQEVTYLHPFLRPRFLESMARAGGATGLGTRTQVMHRLFEDVLPHAILERRSKATFNRVVHGRLSRAFVEQWDGRGVDHDVVDADALLAEWRSTVPSGRIHALLQAVWLATRPASGQGFS